MKRKDFSETNKKLWEMLKKNKYVIAVLLVGAVLITWPVGSKQKNLNESAGVAAGAEALFSLQEQEKNWKTASRK